MKKFRPQMKTSLALLFVTLYILSWAHTVESVSETQVSKETLLESLYGVYTASVQADNGLLSVQRLLTETHSSEEPIKSMQHLFLGR